MSSPFSNFAPTGQPLIPEVRPPPSSVPPASSKLQVNKKGMLRITPDPFSILAYSVDPQRIADHLGVGTKAKAEPSAAEGLRDWLKSLQK
jgi:hypothetical protein